MIKFIQEWNLEQEDLSSERKFYRNVDKRIPEWKGILRPISQINLNCKISYWSDSQNNFSVN